MQAQQIEEPGYSQRGRDWLAFSHKVLEHIEQYTIQQYGDKGEDMASRKDVGYFIGQIEKYLERYGNNARTGEQERDLLKIAHYAQLAHDKGAL